MEGKAFVAMRMHIPKFLQEKRVKQAALICGLLAIFLVIHFATGLRFLTPKNMGIIISHAIIPTFIVWGISFSFTSGMTDLSVGAVMILASNVAGFVGLRFGYIGLIVGGLLAAVLLECLNAIVFLKTRIPPWVAGLGMAMVYESIGASYSGYAVRHGTNIVSLGTRLRSLGQLPYNVLALLGGFVLAYTLFMHTSIGLNIRAVGSDTNVAQKMGINPDRARFLGMIACGIFLGLGSAVNESYVGRILPQTGLASVSLVFEPLAALLIAMAISSIFSLTIGALIGTVSLAALFNALTILGVPSGTWQEVILGLCVIVVAMISQQDKRGVVK